MDLKFIKPKVIENKKSDLTLAYLLKPSDENCLFSIFGYPDDEGISLNGGTPGAKAAPASIRNILYKMTPQKKRFYNKFIYDEGDLSIKNTSLEERQDFASKKVEKALSQNKKVISLGGGHDYGYVDGRAFAELQNKEALVFNFDAHFDLRNLDKGTTSGTPFYKLNELYKNKLNLFEIGIQKHCNSSSLFEYAGKNNIHILSHESLYNKGSLNFKEVKSYIDSHTSLNQDCYISIDIDGFSSAFAPGCSQSWPTGFDVEGFFEIFNYLLKRFNTQILGVYEVSPPLDHNFMTSRLAALIIYRFMESCEV